MQVPESCDPRTLWSGSFGDAYTDRNRVDYSLRKPFWQRMIDITGARSFLDIGCNAGWNMMSLRELDPDFEMSGVDINRHALEQAKAAGLDVYELPADEVVKEFGTGCADLVVTSGVLIHIPPEDLVRTMAAILDASRQWVLAIEYPSDRQVAVEYRGIANALWKNDFGKLYADRGLTLVETGKAEGFSDCEYWLLEKA